MAAPGFRVSMKNPFAPRQWLPHERPMMPGSPSTPLHSPPKRLAYAVVGFIITLTGGLSNALVTANQQNLQGALGVFTAEIAWLPAAYVMTNVSMNLLLVKFRQEFGLRLFTEVFLVLYALITFGHLFANDLGSALAVRAAHGMTGAALSSLGIYYTLQGFPPAWRMRGMAYGVSLTALALPLARILPVEMLEFSEWRGLYLFELGLSLISLGCVLLLKLPPGDRVKTFEKADFITFVLFAPGMALLCAVLSLGRTLWWFDTPWIGWALAGGIALVATAIYYEHHRANPLINLRWWVSPGMLRMGLLMALVRFVLAEQSTTGAVGLMQAMGLGVEHMQPMFYAMFAGTVAGIVVCTLTLNPQRLMLPVVLSLLMIIVGAWMDSQATNLTRPAQMVLSQFLLAFGGTWFLAPVMFLEIGSILAQPRNLISFIVLFGISQNVGGLLGSAMLGTFQTWREKFHSSHIVEHLSLLEPQVVARIHQGSSLYSHTTTDPVLNNVQGMASLAAAATREAHVRAYNDVFLLVAAIAALVLFFVLAQALWLRLNKPKAVPAAAAAR